MQPSFTSDYSRRMKRTAITSMAAGVSLAILLISTILAGVGALKPERAQAQAPTSPTMSQSLLPQTIVVVGEGSIKIEPDIAQVNIGVEIVDPSIQTATSTARETIQQILDTLAAQGIAAEDIQTHSFNVNVERTPAPLPPAGEIGDSAPSAENMQVNYRVTNQLIVVVRDLENLGTILDSAIEAGANFIYGINFLREDTTTLEATVREQAFADARAKAEELAQLAGVALGDVVSISEIVGSFAPVPVAYGLGAAAVPVLPGQVELSTRLQVTYAIDRAAGDSASGSDAAPSASSSAAMTATAVATSTETITSSQEVTASAAITAPEDATGSNAAAAARAPVGSALVTAVGPAGSGAVTIVGGDESSLREFMRHNFISPFVVGEEQATTVYIGELPPTLPLTLELPAGVTVVGSVVSTGQFGSTHLFLSQEGDSAQSIAALRQQLLDQGYIQPSDVRSGQVFEAQAVEYSPLCSADDTHHVLVSGRNLADGTATIRLIIQDTPRGSSICSQSMGSAASSELDAVLPNLSAPAGTVSYQSGFSTSDQSVEASLGFSSDTTIAALAEHYNAQMEAAGWQLLGASETEHMAWSGWSKSQEETEFFATLTLISDAGSTDRFRATLRVEYAR